MTGLEYEKVAAQYLRRHGYSDVTVTKASGDFGVDITARRGSRKYAVQCKYYSSPVGVEAIQEVTAGKAVYNCDSAMVISNNTFTKAAITLAKKNGVLLLSNISSPGEGGAVAKGISYTIPCLLALACLAGLWVAAGDAIIAQIQARDYKLAIFNIASILAVFVGVVLLATLYYKRKHKKRRRATQTVAKAFSDKAETETDSISRVLMRGTPKKHFSIKGEIESGQKYSQTAEHYGELDNSTITGLPHKFTVLGKHYDIDKIEDIKAFPLNFSSFQINGTNYFFNDYFRLCAKFYRDKGYIEIADALESKAVEIETEPLFGLYVKENSRTIIRPPQTKK